MNIEPLQKIYAHLTTGQRRLLRASLRHNGNVKASKYERLYDLLASYAAGRLGQGRSLTDWVVEKGIASADEVGKIVDVVFKKALQVLRGTNTEHALQQSLHNMILDIHFLRQHEFIDEAADMIVRAKELARLVDRADMMLDVLQIERVFWLVNNKAKFSDMERANRDEQERYTSDYFSLLHLRNLYVDVARAIQMPRTTESEEVVQALKSAIEGIRVDQMRSFRCRRMYFLARMGYHFFMGFTLTVQMDEDERKSHLQKRVEYSRLTALLYEEEGFEHFQQEEASWYIQDVSNHVPKAIIDFDMDSVRHFLPKIDRRERGDAEYFNYYVRLRMHFYARMCQYGETKRFIESEGLAKRLLNVQAMLPRSTMSILVSFFLDTMFFHEEWGAVCVWVSRALGKTGKMVRPDLRLYFCGLDIIARWELGEFDKHKNPDSVIEKIRRDDDANYKQTSAYRMMIRFQTDLVRNGRAMPRQKFKEWREKIWQEINGKPLLEQFHSVLMWIDFKLGVEKRLIDISNKKAEELVALHGNIDFDQIPSFSRHKRAKSG
ncbi:MAG: hypothetical protein ACK4Q5_08135 [Saprospiraceae bacterium]